MTPMFPSGRRIVYQRGNMGELKTKCILSAPFKLRLVREISHESQSQDEVHKVYMRYCR